MHDGTIVATSDRPGSGATFVITLNAIETSLLDGPVAFASDDEGKTECAEILLVEDHPDTGRVLRRLLTKAGYMVSLADTVAAARALAAEGRFDLVISDVAYRMGPGSSSCKNCAPIIVCVGSP